MDELPESEDHESEDPELGEPGSGDLFERMNFVVDRHQEPLRIDKYLVTRMAHASRNKIQQAAESSLIRVNDQPVPSNYRVRPGDHIILFTTRAPDLTEITPEPIPLDIVFEDQDLVVINKPAGMVVHPGSGNYTGTLVHGLAYHLYGAHPEKTGVPRFGLVHRIDKNTSGLLVAAKTASALNDLAGQFFDHKVNREYQALVWGDMEQQEGTIQGNVGRHLRFRKIMDVYPDGEHGKPATTHYRVLERFGYTTLLACRLETGRTHQIRVHMQHVGHPLFNDATYGGDRIVKGTVFTKYRQFVENCFALIPRQALHARTLGFIHPGTGKAVHFEAPLPEDFQLVLEKWRGYGRRNESGESRAGKC
ncbi:MAG TPA: RluA family pseudouridine synthase [Chitinophagaceae bacterium]|nr:RluA family pseudouridine synthase [Chitinophagaceae bacterium]